VSRKKLIFTVISSVFALMILAAWSPWNKYRYHGDGKFSDGGFFGHPRFVVSFPDLSLNETSRHQYNFRGLPNEEMTLVLHVVDRPVRTSEDRIPLERLKTTIEARLTDDHGKEVCHGLGGPGPGSSDGIWVLRERGDESAYWHWQCAHIQVYPNLPDILTIQVTAPELKDEKIVVIPKLEGGGLDLP
jgi:hypothetical protein